MAEVDLTVTHRIEASPDLLYSWVSDVTRMGEWSPENLGARWRKGSTKPAVGAQFRGANRRGWRRWSTNCTVVVADPGRCFAFEVAVVVVPASRWTYEFIPDGDGTIVRETWSDLRPRWLDLLARPTMGIADIREHNRRNMEQTLSRLALKVEQRRIDTVELDHVVIHIDDWEACNSFYRDVLGAELVENPEAVGNPLPAFAYRFGQLQVNVHGPWPGMARACCPPPLNEVGRGDLAFRSERSVDEIRERLGHHGVTITAGPIRRFGSRGWGTSVYCYDPSGNGIEIITYE